MESTADILVPDGTDLDDALARTSQLGIGAHPDDLEIMAITGILQCLSDPGQWFTGVVVCDGAGSPRQGPYADYSDAQMVELRREEQRAAARLGQYSAQLQLGASSAAVKQADNPELVESLAGILSRARPRVLYLHNLADNHATHRAVVRHCIEALRQLSADHVPDSVYGVEVWGSLDWLPSPLRVALPVDDPEQLQARLLRCHDSQVGGGKRYDEAFIARQRANATLMESHATDRLDACLLAMNLLPLVEDPTLSIDEHLERCTAEFTSRIKG